MKKLILLASLIPALSYANLYSCTGSGFELEVGSNPLEMVVKGNGFNNRILNLNSTATFDTVITGNSNSPAATLKLVIKDSSFANPGDSFKAVLTVSTPTSIKEFTGMTCVRGND